MLPLAVAVRIDDDVDRIGQREARAHAGSHIPQQWSVILLRSSVFGLLDKTLGSETVRRGTTKSQSKLQRVQGQTSQTPPKMSQSPQANMQPARGSHLRIDGLALLCWSAACMDLCSHQSHRNIISFRRTITITWSPRTTYHSNKLNSATHVHRLVRRRLVTQT